MWRKYFKVVRVVPGRVITHRFGPIDLSSNNLSIDMLKQLYEDDFPYLEITPLGLQQFYGIVPPEPILHPIAPNPDFNLAAPKPEPMVTNLIPKKKFRKKK